MSGADRTITHLPDHRLGRSVWITWERQRRNAGVANALGVPLCEFDFHYGRLRRYRAALNATYWELKKRRPELIFVQNPSLVLTCAALLYGRLHRIPVIVDAHNAALVDLEWSPGSWAARFAIRHAFLTIVSNERLSPVVEAYGGRPFVLPDRVPDLPTAPIKALPGRHQALFICTYASDEPFLAVIEAARALDPDTMIFVTGDPKKRLRQLRRRSPPNVTFTGFLPEIDYISLLRSVDVVIDLTARDDCLVCGAYEGVAAEQPLILSDTEATRRYFNRGVRYTDNSPEDLARAIEDVLKSKESMRAEIRTLKPALVADWNRRRQALAALLGAPALPQADDR